MVRIWVSDGRALRDDDGHLDALHLAQLNRDVIQLIFLWGGHTVTLNTLLGDK